MWKVFMNTGKKHVAGQPKELLNLDLLEAKVMLGESYLESKPAFDPMFDAILIKQKEEYENQIARFLLNQKVKLLFLTKDLI